MLLGPVFRAELLRASRQRRYYALRLMYGLILLLMVWVGYERMRWSQPVAGLADVAAFAARTFESFADVQLITVLLLIPAVFGGAIADEKQRKTLHYLMASQLSGGEIVVDKVLARSAHLAVFVLIGLPIVSLLGLFGGISADSVVMAYVGTFSSSAFAVSLTVLVSTLARRVRDAIVTSYLLMLGWLFVPPLLWLFGSALRPAAYFWIQPVNDWLAGTSPIGLWIRSWFSRSAMRLGLTGRPIVEPFLWMVGFQLAGVALFLLLAIWRLRPTFRRQEETPARRTWFRARGEWRRTRSTARPACGDDPILWKERYFAPVDRFTRVVVLPAIVIVTLPLALITGVEGEVLWRPGFDGRGDSAIWFVWALQLDLGWYVALWLLAIAGTSAASVTIEREKDTWISLTATPLTGREILRGKLLGAMWNQRGFAAVLILVWGLGLFTCAVHPLGILVSIALVVILTWFVATVGVYASLRASSTSRALTTTLTILACVNGYPLILLFWFLGNMSWNSSYPILGAMPSMAAWSMASNGTIDRLWTTLRSPYSPLELLATFIVLALSVPFHFVGATLALRRRIIAELDRWLDRPVAAAGSESVG